MQVAVRCRHGVLRQGYGQVLHPSADHCKSLSAVNVGRRGKVAVAADQPVGDVDVAVDSVGDDAAVAIKQPAGAEAALSALLFSCPVLLADLSVMMAEVDVAAIKNGDPCQRAKAQAVAIQAVARLGFSGIEDLIQSVVDR